MNTNKNKDIDFIYDPRLTALKRFDERLCFQATDDFISRLFTLAPTVKKSSSGHTGLNVPLFWSSLNLPMFGLNHV